MPRATPLDDRDAKKAALLASQGQRQIAISRVLGLSQASVSRLLQRAREKDWLIDEPICTLEPAEKQRLEMEMQGTDFRDRLERIVGPAIENLQEIRIIDGGGPAPIPEQYAQFGENVARHLHAEVLDASHLVGVAWGRTLRSVVAALAELKWPRNPAHPIEFVPTCGDPPDAWHDPYQSPSFLAAELRRIIGGAQGPSHALSGVPACVVEDFTDTECRTIVRFFASISSYGEIFGPDPETGASKRTRRGLIDRLDTLLTGVGTMEETQNPWFRATGASPARHERLRKCAYGNIGGVFIERPGLSEKDRAFMTLINERWIGAGRRHFEGCVSRALAGAKKNKPLPGVVVIAMGKKGEIVREALRHRLISRILIDHTLARDLLDDGSS